MTSGSDLFVGRVTELAELAAILRDRQGGVVLVAGQAGIGKSRLVAEALRVSASPAVRASCWQGDGAPAFWPWTQVIRGCVGFEAGAAWRDGTGTSVDEVIALLPEATLRTAGASRADVGHSDDASRRLRLSVCQPQRWKGDRHRRLLRFLARERQIYDAQRCAFGIYDLPPYVRSAGLDWLEAPERGEAAAGGAGEVLTAEPTGHRAW